MMLIELLGPGEARLNHGKAGLHEKHQTGRHQRPQVVGVGLNQVDGLFIGQNGGFGISRHGSGDAHQGNQYQQDKCFQFHFSLLVKNISGENW